MKTIIDSIQEFAENIFQDYNIEVKSITLDKYSIDNIKYELFHRYRFIPEEIKEELVIYTAAGPVKILKEE